MDQTIKNVLNKLYVMFIKMGITFFFTTNVLSMSMRENYLVLGIIKDKIQYRKGIHLRMKRKL